VALLANNKLGWKNLARFKRSSLLGYFVSDEEKKVSKDWHLAEFSDLIEADLSYLKRSGELHSPLLLRVDPGGLGGAAKRPPRPP